MQRRADRRAGSADADGPTPTPGPVTAITEHRRRRGRFVVEVRGVAAALVPAEVIVELALRIGGEVGEAQLDLLAVRSREIACYDRAVEALARRARSIAELVRWLRRRGFEAPAITWAIERLRAQGLVDDEAFARAFALSRMTGRGFGARRVVAELRWRGVDPRVIVGALADLREEEGLDERAALRAAARRRLPAVERLEPAVARRRLLAWLARRGFSSSEAWAEVAALLPDADG